MAVSFEAGNTSQKLNQFFEAHEEEE